MASSWKEALEIFDRVKGSLKHAGQVEKALTSLGTEDRLLIFRGSENEILERLAAYDTEESACTTQDGPLISASVSYFFNQVFACVLCY
jgi:hypothetical protein